MNKLLPKLLLKLTAILLFIAPYSVNAQCTGFSFNIENITVTSITNSNIFYTYTIRNTGASTVSTNNLLIQNNLSSDQLGTSTSSAGGSFIFGSVNIGPNETYTGTFQSSAPNLTTYPYLQVDLQYAISGNCQLSVDKEYECLRPDAQFTSFTINNTQAASISYEFQLKNVGADTLFLSQLELENFLSTNSTYDGSDVAAGSGVVTISGKTYLLANQTGVATFTTSGSNSGYGYLVTKLTYTEQTECSVGNNEAIEPIPALNGLFSTAAQESNSIIWNSELKHFIVDSWNDKISGENLNYEIYNSSGMLQSSGATSIGEATTLNAAKGFYVLIVSDGKKKYSKKIIY